MGNAEYMGAAEQRAKEEVERKAAEDVPEEDPWFSDFFSETKKAADGKLVREKEEAERHAAEERRKKEKAEAAEEQRRAEERARKKAVQDQGKSAMEARLQAQKQAAE